MDSRYPQMDAALCLVLLLGWPAGFSAESTAAERWLTQPLDHFDPTEARSWQQRYFVYDKHHNESGPFFLLLGDDGAARPSQLTGSFVARLAEKFGASCFLLEQRFYGKSQPTYDASTRNLRYLGVEQVLADAAYFINELGPRGAKWIVFGEWYAGAFAAWIRLKYPHLVHAAVADSAPLLAQPEFPDYHSEVERLYKKHSPSCSQVLGDALSQVHQALLRPNPNGVLKSLFNLCEPISVPIVNKHDVSSLFIPFLGVSEYPALKRGINETGPNIPKICELLLDESRGSTMERLAASFELVLSANNASCLRLLDYTGRLAPYMTKNSEERISLYQDCTELGRFPTFAAQPWGMPSSWLPLEFYISVCEDVFGPGFMTRLTRGTERINDAFAGRDLAAATSRTVFVMGSDDPWNKFGVGGCDNPEVACINVQDSLQRPLQYRPSDNDTQQVREAQKKVEELINGWLNENK